jgi:2-oxoglutarate ferredoxin oxidoreductase subunit alpha
MKDSDTSVLTGEHFMNGDTACAEGGLACGCRFFAGYPITPATEVAERMARRLPQVGGVYIQMEDEIASMNAVLGAAWGGALAMTATSGPGFSLMMENIGLALMTETPCVVVNVQRGGPSTGLPTLTGQGDVMQARWGSHGDYELIALAPQSPQECFDLTIEAFVLSEQYRVPVLVMSDEVVGHMMEKVVIPAPDKIPVPARRRPKRSSNGDAAAYLPFAPCDDLVPEMALAGDGYHIHVTGLTHDERGYPATNAVAHEKLIRRLVEKITRSADQIVRVQECALDDAEVGVVAYGITARVARRAVQMARDRGIRAGLLRLITLWPFAETRVRQLARQCGALVMAEVNMGQLVREVERCSGGTPVVPVLRPGGEIHEPAEILAGIERAALLARAAQAAARA